MSKSYSWRVGNSDEPRPDYTGRGPDDQLLMRALGILHRMATEQTGWRKFLSRWYYSDEPLRNDAANLVREACFDMPRPVDTRLIGEGS